MPTAEEPGFSLRVPATAQALEAINGLLARFWDNAPGFNDADRMRFELAVAEVANNIVEHSTAMIELTLNLRRYEDRVEADFDEAGAPLPADVIETAAAPDDPFAESGRGLVMARAVLDEFAYERTGDRNHWHLVRHRHHDD